MKKSFVLIAASVVAVGLGAVGAVAKETIKVRTSATIKYKANEPSDPHGGGLVSGQVKAREGCQKRRKVVLYDSQIEPRGKDLRTNNRGKYKIEWLEVGHVAGGFFVKVRGKTITKGNGDTVVCSAGKSEPFRFH